MSYISLKKLLTESTEMEYKAIQKNCSEALFAYSKGVKFYRGDTSFYRGIQYIDPRVTERKSKNTNNIFTTLVKGSGQWEKAGIPLRNKSILFSTQLDGAEGYSGYKSGVYMVFPVNGANIGYGQEADNWSNYEIAGEFLFHDTHTDVAEFCNIIEDYLKHCVGDDVAENCATGNNYEYLKEAIESGEQHLEAYIKNDALDLRGVKHSEKLKMMIDKAGSVWDGCLKFIDPDFNKIQHIKLSQMSPINDTKELWTDSPCYFVQRDSPSFDALGLS